MYLSGDQERGKKSIIYLSLLYCLAFSSFGFEGWMCDLIVLIPDYSLSIYFICIKFNNLNFEDLFL